MSIFKLINLSELATVEARVRPIYLAKFHHYKARQVLYGLHPILFSKVGSPA